MFDCVWREAGARQLSSAFESMAHPAALDACLAGAPPGEHRVIVMHSVLLLILWCSELSVEFPLFERSFDRSCALVTAAAGC